MNMMLSIDLLSRKSDGEWPPGLKVEVMEWIASHDNELMEEWKKWHE